MTGYVARPDLSALKMDTVGVRLLPKIAAAYMRGDDAILRVLIDTFENEGFRVVGQNEVWSPFLMPEGKLGKAVPQEEHWADIRKAVAVLRSLGPFDIGQGAVVCLGAVLAIEAAEGTDEMLRRTASIRESLPGGKAERHGVLVKIPKSGQERRTDLPTIGVRTLELCLQAGLSGIALAANESLLTDANEIRNASDAEGFFVFGFLPTDIGDWDAS
jgi:DUF1009 family protein